MSNNLTLNTLLKALVDFYNVKLGEISMTLWTDQEELGLINADVVQIIRALAEAKETIQLRIDDINELVSGANTPE